MRLKYEPEVTTRSQTLRPTPRCPKRFLTSKLANARTLSDMRGYLGDTLTPSQTHPLRHGAHGREHPHNPQNLQTDTPNPETLTLNPEI